MLNGIDPILIFQFGKALPAASEALAKIPIISQVPTIVEAPPIPIYLSQTLTGLHVDSESKNIDASTATTTKTDGSAPDVDQKGVGSIVAVNIVASKTSIGITLLSAMMDQVFERMTSKEYAITYLHGAVTVFRGLLHSFSIDQNSNDTRYLIRMELSRGGAKSPTKVQVIPSVPGVSGTLPI